MLATLKKRLSPRERRNAFLHSLTERLLERLARQGSFVLEPGNLAELAAGREQVLRVVYALLLGERLHLTSNDAGQAVAMSNHEFENRLRQRAAAAFGSGSPDDPQQLTVSAMEAPEAFPLAVAPVGRETTEEERAGLECALEGIFAASAFAREETGDMADATAAAAAATDAAARQRPILPLARQSLPERRREPWTASDRSEVRDE